jgi:hypothetical protein
MKNALAYLCKKVYCIRPTFDLHKLKLHPLRVKVGQWEGKLHAKNKIFAQTFFKKMFLAFCRFAKNFAKTFQSLIFNLATGLGAGGEVLAVR